ncbi:hypothetical protein Tco_1400083 [Tanacetum coccineum]
MNQEKIRQVTTRDEKWVPTKERVKISTTNARMETTVRKKEETFLVIIDVIKNSTCYKAFTISTETTLTFLIDLGYKGPLYKHPSMYVDHMHQPWRILAAIINKCLSGKAASNDREYGLPILETMLTEGIKQLESYQMFIKYSTGVLPPKKSRDDNIIPELDVALELVKSMSLTEVVEEEAARQVHATHERIVTESDLEPARRRPSEQLVADMMEALKASRKSIRSLLHAGGSSKGTGSKLGVPNESTVTPTTSSEGTGDDDGNIKWVDTDEEEEKNDDDDDDKIIILEKTDDEETDNEFVHSEENVQDDDEETDDKLVHADEQVNDDEDEEITNAKDADTGNGDEEITDTAKLDTKKTKVVKDDIKKAELPPTSSSLSISLGFVHVTTLIPPLTVSSISHVQLQTTTSIPSPPITTKAPPVTKIPDPLLVILQRVFVLEEDVQELKEVVNTTTLRASLRSEIPSVVNAYLGSSLGDSLQKVLQRHTEELIQKYPQQVDYKETIKESVQANIINEVKNQFPKFLPKAVSDFTTPVIQSTVKNALEKTPLLLTQSSSQAQSSLKAEESLSECELKMILFDKMDKSRSYLTHDKYQVLFDALLNYIILDDAVTRGQANPEKVLLKRDRKSPAKTSKSGKSVTVEELVEEPVFEMASNDIERTIDDVANDTNQPPDDSTQIKDKDPKKDWFK